MKTRNQIANDLTNWMNNFYSYSSEDPKAESYPDFIKLKQIIKELRKRT